MLSNRLLFYCRLEKSSAVLPEDDEKEQGKRVDPVERGPGKKEKLETDSVDELEDDADPGEKAPE